MRSWSRISRRRGDVDARISGGAGGAAKSPRPASAWPRRRGPGRSTRGRGRPPGRRARGKRTAPIGRAACGGKGEISGGAASFKKKKKNKNHDLVKDKPQHYNHILFSRYHLALRSAAR